LLKQAEVDVLGFKVAPGGIPKLVAVDVAFHSSGLQYGDKDVTAERVAKKLFRAALVADSCFPGVEAEIIFAAPKVFPATLNVVRKAEEAVREFFQERRRHFTFNVMVNQDFEEKILHPVLALKDDVADTSELFLRAVQMVGMFKESKRSPVPPEKASLRSSIPSLKPGLGFSTEFDSKDRLNITAYYLSKFDHDHLNFGNQGETFAYFAGALNLKEASLRTTRDLYDPLTGSHRKGFHQVAPSSEKIEIHRKYKDMDEEELRRIVLGFIQ